MKGVKIHWNVLDEYITSWESMVVEGNVDLVAFCGGCILGNVKNRLHFWSLHNLKNVFTKLPVMSLEIWEMSWKSRPMSWAALGFRYLQKWLMRIFHIKRVKIQKQLHHNILNISVNKIVFYFMSSNLQDQSRRAIC